MDAKIIPYDVEKLGYYPIPGRQAPTYADASTLLTNLVKWAGLIPNTENTATYHNGGPAGTNLYFADGYTDEVSGDVVLVMWKECHHSEDGILGLPRKAKPGTNKLTRNKINVERDIPGAPSYYWYCKEENKLYALRFKHSVVAKTEVRNYIDGFLKFYSPNARYRTTDKGRKVFSGFKDVSKTPPVTHCDTKVEVKINFQLIASVKAYLRNNLKKIKSIKEEFDIAYFDNSELTGMQKLSRFQKNQKQRIVDQGKVSIEQDWIATEESIDYVIDKVRHINTQAESVKDIKIVLKNAERDNVSLFESSMRAIVSLDVVKKPNEFIKAVDLFNALKAKERAIISAVSV